MGSRHRKSNNHVTDYYSDIRVIVWRHFSITVTMSMITIGLDENKKYARANPPGGFTSNAFDFQYEGEKKTQPRKMHHVVGSSNPSLSNDNNDNVYGFETEALDNAANQRP